MSKSPGIAAARPAKRRPTDGRVDRPPVFDIEVQRAHGRHNLYGYDIRRQRVTLHGTGRSADGPADLAVVPRAVQRESEPVYVLLLVEPPTFPGCGVAARLTGGLEAADGRFIAVAVPDVGGHEIAGEPPWDALSRQAAEALTTSAVFRRLTAEATADRVREAKHKWQIERAAQEGVRWGAAWRVESLGPRRSGEAEPHTEAERMLPLLPFRFQKYIADVLFDDERIILFVERPPLRTGGFIGRRQLHEGVLVITDRAVLMMEDVIPPDATMVHWGFDLLGTAIERVEAASVRETGRHGVMELTVAAAGGSHRVETVFPLPHLPALEEAAALLQRFRAQERPLPRRLYIAPEQWSRFPAAEDAGGPLAAVTREGRSLTLSDASLSVDGGTGPVVPLNQIAALRLRLSLIRSGLSVIWLANGSERTVDLSFDYPEAPPFHRLFGRIRHALGRP